MPKEDGGIKCVIMADYAAKKKGDLLVGLEEEVGKFVDRIHDGLRREGK